MVLQKHLRLVPANTKGGIAERIKQAQQSQSATISRAKLVAPRIDPEIEHLAFKKKV